MPVVVDQRKDSGLDRVARIGKFAAEAFLHTERKKQKQKATFPSDNFCDKEDEKENENENESRD